MIVLSRDSDTSKALAILRFPLAALIVFIHTSFSPETSDLSYYIGTLVSLNIASVAVPTFFFISGYLFFARYEVFGWKEYTIAMRRKFVTLAIPYLLWIAISYYGMGVITGFRSGPEPWDVYRIFWAESDGFVVKSLFGYTFSILSTPASLGVLWFVRDLMVAMLLTPLIYRIVKWLRLWSIGLFLIPYLLFIAIPVKGFGLVALCFFPIGAAFSICGTDIVKFLTGWSRWIVGVFATIVLLKWGMDICQVHCHRVLGQLLIITGIASAIVIANYLGRYTRASDTLILLGETSFFIYVGHALPIVNAVNKLFVPIQDIPYAGYTCYYFIWWGFRIAVVIALYYVMKRICPSALSVLVGGRTKVSTRQLRKELI